MISSPPAKRVFTRNPRYLHKINILHIQPLLPCAAGKKGKIPSQCEASIKG